MSDIYKETSKERVTVKSLAKDMGISHTTVSNAWNNPDKLSASLRERILSYANSVGFQGPDKLARALRTGKSDTIGVIFNDSMSYVFIDPHDIKLMRGIAVRCEEQNTNLVLIPLKKGATSAAPSLTTLVDGYILNATHNSAAIIQQTLARSLPVVTLDFQLPQYSSVSIDNASAMRDITTYLINKGHRHFGIISFSSSPGIHGIRNLEQTIAGDNTLMLTRVNACRETFLQYAIPSDDCWLYETSHDEQHGELAAETLLARHPAITALICLSDRFAIGAMNFCQRNNLAIPQQIAITGFDNITPEVNGIGLTTIAQDAERKGEIAVELLLNNGPITHHALEYQLIVRETA
ncbi:LacI family DNA-binding transcriptional regulator [Kluyvera sp. STS39-E]|uniref:LacI family DNA-binding transcriptional regulator n=1 Tax=Kluyvera sp. STS39-E TaxID=3234748 RepID=UPI0034C6021F